ncbi:MAG: methyltransferase domain-containing protein [Armatimonadetes bacterium]|nr:methyltransferase domain-containing protein [Armatimonadota bacterium]
MPVEREHIHARIVRILGRRKCVLDVGCGNCDLVRFLARTVADRAIGIDVNSGSVSEKVASDEDGSLRTARCEQMDAHSMREFRNATFDAVVTVHALHEIATPKTALREIKRVLKPGGTLVIADFTKGETRWQERYFTPAEVKTMLTETGFATVRVAKVRGEHFMYATATK